MKENLPQKLYVDALVDDFTEHFSLLAGRKLTSIFFGGGTPSLFSAHAINDILTAINRYISFSSTLEITLEANPGTIDQAHFKDYRHAGINRLSLGIQSLQNEKLKILGRIHDREHALKAIKIAREAGFTNVNLDLMYGLPQQSIADALEDMQTALAFAPAHFSWYQLTIEPNTFFHHQPPVLPADDLIWEMQLAGQALLQQAGLHQYEVSAYALANQQCAHNRNYWEFGDYLGMGAGAHSKITQHERIIRFSQVKNPRDYLIRDKKQLATQAILSQEDLIFEFMLNALRLTDGIEKSLFTIRTGIRLETIQTLLDEAYARGWLNLHPDKIQPSELGKRYLNDLVGLFL